MSELSAFSRVLNYVTQRTGRRGLDPDVVHAMDIGAPTEAELTLSDLRALLADAAIFSDAAMTHSDSLATESHQCDDNCYFTPADGVTGNAQSASPASPSLRDQFAMVALTGLIALDREDRATWPTLAASAYAAADALLAAREKRP